MSKASNKTKSVVAKTLNQKRFLQAINEKDFIFCDGPAGCGKSFLAVGMACEYLLKGKVDKIVFARSSSHLVKEMGYSSGNWKEKNLVFFDQIREYLIQFLGKNEYERMWGDDIIELTSTAIIRGRSFLNAFIVMEESEMSSKEDFILFLSRLDRGSKAVFIGDRYQNGGDDGYWAKLIDNLEDEDVAMITLTEEDICRHKSMYRICKKIAAISR